MPDLSVPTRFIPLGFVPVAIAIALILGGLYGVLHFLLPWLGITFAGQLPSPMAVFDRVLSVLVTWGLLLFLVSLFVPTSLKKALWLILSGAGRGLWKLLWRSSHHTRRY